jgi:hypothetical protein
MSETIEQHRSDALKAAPNKMLALVRKELGDEAVALLIAFMQGRPIKIGEKPAE